MTPNLNDTTTATPNFHEGLPRILWSSSEVVGNSASIWWHSSCSSFTAFLSKLGIGGRSPSDQVGNVLAAAMIAPSKNLSPSFDTLPGRPDMLKTDKKLYGDFLPSADECTSFLLSTEKDLLQTETRMAAFGMYLEDLLELQDEKLASTMREQQHRALEFWEKNWHPAVPLKIKRLARDLERFIWAMSIAQSRCINLQTRIGALIQDANMLVPYAVKGKALHAVE
ncbi:hypothetical protein RND71_034016 [Anisodus tanguticus]|uniref:Uncharacterized protein n=1 Tax=Anisodus tanguticus TaxID=243964 RepID=A0AAE1UY06_9SOLA|nr:hypothetical protein RND71_034016 [Anisodus tanguticus]